MDKIVSKIAALGVPGLVLTVAIGATGLAGGVAITTALDILSIAKRELMEETGAIDFTIKPILSREKQE